MLLFAAGTLSRLKDIPPEIWKFAAIGVGVIVAIVIVMRKLAGANKIWLTIIGAVAFMMVGFQWIYNVPSSLSNPLGFETTGVRSIWVGPEVVTPNAQYVWDLSNVNNATGNATTNSVPVVRFTTL